MCWFTCGKQKRWESEINQKGMIQIELFCVLTVDSSSKNVGTPQLMQVDE
jgi:hypothetical protein